MNLEERVQLLQGIAGGNVSLRAVSGLTSAEIARMSAMGRVAYESGVFDKGDVLVFITAGVGRGFLAEATRP